MILNFGATGVTGADCPAAGDWSAWCDCAFPASPTDPLTNGKCKSWRPGAPWTLVGATLRGIPHLGTEVLPAEAGGLVTTIMSLFGGGTPPPAAAPVVVDDGIFGVPKMVALVGGSVLVLGTAAFLATRKKGRRSMAAYRRRRTRRR